jgi:putative endonuclease
MANYVYLVKCADKTYYCGWTSNLKNRIKTHNLGQGAKYTRGRLPVKLVYAEKKKSKSTALKREIEIKKYSRKQKQALIKNK